MDNTFLLVVLTVALALFFDFINGFHDTANAIATAVSTHALRLRTAIIMASLMNFAGAIAFTGVAKTITKGIVNPYHIPHGSVVIICALISAIMWNLLTWYLGIPSSSSHTLIGSIAGASVAAAGIGALNMSGFINILKGLVFSPFLAFAVGYLMLSLFKVLLKNSNLHETNYRFRKLQILTVCLQAFTHGTNDAQKSMGVITLALLSAKYHTGSSIPFWVQVSCATAMALGTSIGGWRIIKTVGTKIMKIRPVSGVASDISSALIIFGATNLGLPVSTTHVISSAIMGVGTSYRPKAVKWETATRMISTWIITIPISALVAALIFSVVRLMFFPMG